MPTFNLRQTLDTHCPKWLRPVWNRIDQSPLGARLAGGLFWSLSGTIASRVLLLVGAVCVARILGRTGYGQYGMLVSTVGMFGHLAGLGLGLTATKHVAEFRGNNPERAGRILALSTLTSVFSGGLMASLVYVFSPWLADKTLNAPELTDALRIASVILFVTALNGAQGGALAGMEAFKRIAQIDFIVGLITLPVLVAGAYFGGINGAIMGMVGHYIIAWPLYRGAIRKEAAIHKIPLTLKGFSQELPILWTFSIPVVAAGGLFGQALWICKSMVVNQPDGYDEIGAYVVAETWRNIIMLLCGMLTTTVLPIMAQLYGDRKVEAFKKTLRTQMMINAAFTLTGALVLTLASPLILRLYGEEFTDSTLIFGLVLLSIVPQQLSAVGAIVNRCVGALWLGFLMTCVLAIVMIGATYLLIDYGAVGLAIATGLAYTANLIILAFYVRWVFRNDPHLNPERPVGTA